MKTREIKVTSRNQITIPWDLRSIAKWFKPHAKLKVILADDETIILKPIKAKPIKIKLKKPKKLTFSRYLVYKDSLLWNDDPKKK